MTISMDHTNNREFLWINGYYMKVHSFVNIKKDLNSL